MRICVSLRFKELKTLPFNHLFELMSASLNKIGEADPELAYKYHEKPKYKPYNLSWLNIDIAKTSKKGLIPNSNEATYLFNSPNQRLINSFVEGFLANPDLVLKKNEEKVVFELDSIEAIKEPSFDDEMSFETITPVAVRTQEKENGKVKTVDLRPNSKKFYDNLFQNLINRYQNYHQQKPNINTQNIDLKILNSKPKRLKIRNTWQMATQMKFKTKADEKLNKFMYYTGLGERNNQGFGCIEVIKD
ncbi:MAG: CRISPR-Cas system related protein Cas6, RAMP superfamily [Candidatus Methanohalarchaeum thermophilum]|uniref:CRISPR-associated endoribonuclease n=1 Tax=Methanohalarchaeum thermophilum TaxID=1903181 RepID=A0A1Q6DVI4_METT1|nr:MAG: CRISPR-Cas system related protein Cas6, RAMP superfamily [Candidatus Methanohalarchaeum thermophilum]